MNRTKPFIGAIRWDAWFPGTVNEKRERNVGQQVSDTLSQEKYHFRVPYFAQLHNDDVTVTYPQTTQEIFDEEMKYAAEAGIDYFAYCMYEDNSGMEYARVFHTQSKLNTKVKMCAILTAGPYDTMKHIPELIVHFQQDYYMKVLDERPLVFFFSYKEKQTDEEVMALRAACKEKGIKDPYIAAMFWNEHEAKASFFDAVSGYAVSGTDGCSFKMLTGKARDRWEDAKSRSQKLIPLVTAGWDPRPRSDRPVSWMHVNSNSWAQTAKADEIADHLQETITYIDENKEMCEAQALIIYAWNENDEGGWLMPTGKLDANGKLMRNVDGSLIADTKRLEAIKKVLEK